MAYDTPQHEVILVAVAHDFGNGAGAFSFKGPKGKRGVLKDIIVHDVTETFSATTTAAHVQIGTASDADKYADVVLGTLAAGDTFRASQDDADGLIIVDLPEDTQIEVALVSPTGGTPAGIASVSVVVDWY